MNSQRLWGIALGVSLTLNIFCLAALLTNLLVPAQGPDHKRPPLPAEARALFHQIDPRRQPGFHDSIRSLREDREAVRDALTAEPFDAAQLEQALARLRSSETRKAELAHRKIAEVAAQLDAEQRQHLARFVERRRRRPAPAHRPPD